MAKTRVSELAKKYGIPSKEALEKLGSIGEFAKTASSSIEPPAVKKFEDAFGAELQARMKPAAEAAEAPAKKAAAPKPGPKPKASEPEPEPVAPVEEPAAAAAAPAPEPEAPAEEPAAAAEPAAERRRSRSPPRRTVALRRPRRPHRGPWASPAAPRARATTRSRRARAWDAVPPRRRVRAMPPRLDRVRPQARVGPACRAPTRR